MKKYLPITLVVLLFAACKSDQQRQDEFAGSYRVSLEIPDADNELSAARKDMEKDIKKSKKEIRKDIKDAKRDIEDEFGEESSLGKALGSFVDGMGHLAESMTELGRSLGELGISLGTGILEDVHFNAVFQPDGDVVFGKKRGLRIKKSDQLRWKIENGRMHLWNEGENEAEAEVFEIKKRSDDGYDLIGEDVIFHLSKRAE